MEEVGTYQATSVLGSINKHCGDRYIYTTVIDTRTGLLVSFKKTEQRLYESCLVDLKD
tara:strand:- start:1756 stop:1929 length:174 start_codon:yes stop_codon:yes gene_type:complete